MICIKIKLFYINLPSQKYNLFVKVIHEKYVYNYFNIYFYFYLSNENYNVEFYSGISVHQKILYKIK